MFISSGIWQNRAASTSLSWKLSSDCPYSEPSNRNMAPSAIFSILFGSAVVLHHNLKLIEHHLAEGFWQNKTPHLHDCLQSILIEEENCSLKVCEIHFTCSQSIFFPERAPLQKATSQTIDFSGFKKSKECLQFFFKFAVWKPLLLIDAREGICYEVFNQIEFCDNLLKSYLVFIVLTSWKSIQKKDMP